MLGASLFYSHGVVLPEVLTGRNPVDVGRQFYPITFLEELCTYASWWKTSEFVRSRSKL